MPVQYKFYSTICYNQSFQTKICCLLTDKGQTNINLKPPYIQYTFTFATLALPPIQANGMLSLPLEDSVNRELKRNLITHAESINCDPMKIEVI